VRKEHSLRAFENRLLRRMFEPKRYRVTGEWRKLHNEELNDMYPSPNIVWLIKSRRMRWACHVAYMRQRRGAYRVLVGKPRLRGHLEDPDVDVRLILRWIFRKLHWGAWAGLIWLRIRAGVVGFCSHGDEHSGSIKCEEFLD